MSELRKAAQQALEAIEALKAAIERPEQKPQWDEVFDAAVRSWKARTPGRDALQICFQDKSDDSEIFTHWTSRELMDFAEEIASLYTDQQQRKPLTDKRVDVLACAMVKGNKSVNWLCRAIEAAHGSGGDE